MKVSVLMPTYNRAIPFNDITLVERAIISCLTQSYQDYELLILNDGSTDNTSEIIQKYANHAKVKIWDEKTNMMPPNNMNFLWEQATGDLVCQLHDDDEMTPESISIRVAEFEQNKNLDVVYGGWITQGIDGTGRQAYYATAPDAARILKHEYINFTTLMCRRDLPIRFDADLRYYFDWLFKIRCLHEFCTDFVPDPVMIHTVHEGQETTKCRRENANAMQEKMMRAKLFKLDYK